jgi:hypothetical protein
MWWSGKVSLRRSHVAKGVLFLMVALMILGLNGCSSSEPGNTVINVYAYPGAQSSGTDGSTTTVNNDAPYLVPASYGAALTNVPKIVHQ